MRRSLLLFILLLIAIPSMAMKSHVELDRHNGLLIGDIVTEIVTLPVDYSDIVQSSMPQINKRYGPWFALHNVKQLSDKTIQLQWQVVNVPDENRDVSIPKLSLQTNQAKTIEIPAKPVQIGSFLTSSNGIPKPQADILTPAVNLHYLYWQLAIALSVFLLCLLIWAIWYIGFRIGKRLPFAECLVRLRILRALGLKRSSEQVTTTQDAAVRLLHEAFNRSAGSVVIYSDLEALWQHCPWLESLQQEITDFYQHSAEYYFDPKPSTPYTVNEVVRLAKACRSKERLA